MCPGICAYFGSYFSRSAPRRLGGGGGEIRTHGRVAPTTIFKTVAFNRSATPPDSLIKHLPRCRCNVDDVFRSGFAPRKVFALLTVLLEFERFLSQTSDLLANASNGIVLALLAQLDTFFSESRLAVLESSGACGRGEIGYQWRFRRRGWSAPADCTSRSSIRERPATTLRRH